MTGIAIHDEKRDEVILKNEDVEFTMKKKDYDFVKDILTDGISLDELSPIIRPCDIIGYLEETNPEAEKNVVETEVTMSKRNVFSKEQLTLMSIGVLIFMAMIGLGALYILVSASTGDGGGTTAAASTAASSISLS